MKLSPRSPDGVTYMLATNKLKTCFHQSVHLSFLMVEKEWIIVINLSCGKGKIKNTHLS